MFHFICGILAPSFVTEVEAESMFVIFADVALSINIAQSLHLFLILNQNIIKHDIKKLVVP